ncbi:2-oxo acid dehydrogenase subunit E2, partial [Marinobacter sp.]|uniref:2-oxo acid dehydrogenase subunit E2 n=1 Tax=Marinobacter sp. TaxID=50741 RepID=UPI00356271E3
MSEQEIKVPDLGGADEVEIIEIIASEGDTVQEEDPILTVETDKATVELPAPAAGKITKITAKVGDKVKEGDVVGLFVASDTDNPSNTEAEVAASEAEAAPEAKPEGRKPAPKKSSGGARTEIVKVPSLDGMEDIPVIEVNVSEGDTVGEDDALVTVESDKATMEIPSPFAGKIGKIMVQVGDKLSEGDDLLEMVVEDGSDASEESSGDEVREAYSQNSKPDSKPGKQGLTPQALSSAYEPPAPGTKVHAGPAVRKLARELGADLARIKGSGPKGRILKDDVQDYIKAQLQQAQQGSSVGIGAGIPGVKLPDFSQFGDIERESMSRIMFATANNMQRSWLNVPHVTQFDDADITEMEAFRKAQKAAGEKRGVKMTPLPFLLKACAAALAELPQFNVSLDMERKEVVRKKYIHIGIAVDTPHGLMVPVIRDVDQKGLWELAAESAELAQKARDKQLKPAEMQGACFTITSL